MCGRHLSAIVMPGGDGVVASGEKCRNRTMRKRTGKRYRRQCAQQCILLGHKKRRRKEVTEITGDNQRVLKV